MSRSGTLISARDSLAEDVTVHHCDIVNGHDLSVAYGPRARFHHNWVHNLNDDSVIVAGKPSADEVRIYRNAITQCLTALSFAGGSAGQVYIYRNLFDIRLPTLGIRPRATGEQRSLRQGLFYKDGTNEGPFDLFHNTCIILDPGQIGAAGDEPVDAGFAHYKERTGAGVRRAFNNVFVAVYSRPGLARLVAFLPPADFAGPTNGNVYHRFGTGAMEKFRSEDPLVAYPHLADYQSAQPPSELDGRSEDPVFASLPQPGVPATGDDLRLSGGSSPDARHAVALPEPLRSMARWPPWLPDWVPFPNHRGCYRWSGDVLRVGVDGQRRFPTGS
jgi:hypothetical protein